MSDTVWTVSKYTDTMKERKRKVVEYEVRNSIINYPFSVFNSRGEAISFLAMRSSQKVEQCRKTVKREEARHRKLLKKLGVEEGV